MVTLVVTLSVMILNIKHDVLDLCVDIFSVVKVSWEGNRYHLTFKKFLNL